MSDLACSAVIIALAVKRRRDRKRIKRLWTKECYKRPNFTYMDLLKELDEISPCDFKNFLQTGRVTFMDLLEKVTPAIEKQNKMMTNSSSAYERLTAALHFLVTGQNFEDLKFTTATALQTLRKIIMDYATL
jgi:hypothetical protein